MTQLTIDETIAAKLKDMREMVELRDQSGRVVGHFLPGPQRDANGNIIVPFTDEELERRGQERGGRPLKDILTDLSKL